MSSNSFANGNEQNVGNVLTNRRTTRTVAPPGGQSSITFGDEGLTSANEVATRVKSPSAAKLRENAGSGIFGEGRRGDAHDDRLDGLEEDMATLIIATRTDIKAMMLPDLRSLCRAHSLSPAGSRETLVERVCEAIESGAIIVAVPEKRASGISRLDNNYGRVEGQNVGNFLTDRKTSRVLREPGGGSSFIFGGEPPGHSSRNTKMSAHNQHDADALKWTEESRNASDGHSRGEPSTENARDSTASGTDIFPQQRAHHKISQAKLAEFRGNNVFDQTLPDRAPLASHREAAVRAIQGADIFSDELPRHRTARGGARQAPGGNSSIDFASFFTKDGDRIDDSDGEEDEAEGETDSEDSLE